MARVLFLNPGRWGRGITPIWIASHSAALRARGHEVALFDATFVRDWAQNETAFNTANLQYKASPYESLIVMNDRPVRELLQEKVNQFAPDVIFWAAISSHIHGEGEYAAIQLGAELLATIETSAMLIAGGLQPTADPEATAKRFPIIDGFIRGESDLVLAELVDALAAGQSPSGIRGMVLRDAKGQFVANPPQPIISDLDLIGPYDYSLFDPQVLLRPYNGEVVKAVDYELSRGCPFTCGYCVETVIQRYYGFTESNARGALVQSNKYLRSKSAGRVIEEITSLHADLGITFFRCQDTNFLTLDRRVLNGLADHLDKTPLPISLYIETRPEGINASSVALLKRLKVDAVGMGIELSTQDFRESKLNRFSDQEAIIRAFRLLRENGIRRTAYNIIGIPDQTEDSIRETIEFNRLLDPDNMTVAFFSPYLGTEQQERGAEKEYFLDYEFDLDSQLRTLSKHRILTPELLNYYKQNFVRLVRGAAPVAVS